MKMGASVKFRNGFPPEADVLNLLEQQTGLEIHFVEEKGGLYNPEFVIGTEYDYVEDCIQLGSFLTGKDAYLFYATLNVLAKCGGDVTYPTHIPDWSRKKWCDVPRDRQNIIARLVSMLS